MAIVSELIDNASLRVTDAGYEVTRSWRVTDIPGAAVNRIFNMVEHPSIPRYGAPHPTRPELKALDIQCAPEGPETGIITVTYRVPAPAENPETDPGSGGGGGGSTDPIGSSGSITVGATVQTVTTQRDALDEPLLCTISVEQPNETTGQVETIDLEQLGSVDIQVPQFVVRVVRRQNYSPFNDALNFVGKVNSNFQWARDVRTWLCTSIEGSSEDGGRTWSVNYEFQYNDQTWDATLLFIDNETGQPHEQIVLPGNGRTPNGVLVAQVYKAADFGLLGLPR